MVIIVSGLSNETFDNTTVDSSKTLATASTFFGDSNATGADFKGEAHEATNFCGDAGRLAGDCSNDAFNGEALSLNEGGAISSGKTIPRLGEPFMASLNGLGGSRLAGLAVRTLEAGATDFDGELGAISGLKSSFLAAPEFRIDPSMSIEALTGDLLKGLIGVFAPQSSSSELTEEFDLATCVTFFGDRGFVSSFS